MTPPLEFVRAASMKPRREVTLAAPMTPPLEVARAAPITPPLEVTLAAPMTPPEFSGCMRLRNNAKILESTRSLLKKLPLLREL